MDACLSLNTFIFVSHSLAGTIMANLQKDPFTKDIDLWRQIIQNGQRAAIRTLQSDLAVSPLIGHDLLL